MYDKYYPYQYTWKKSSGQTGKSIGYFLNSDVLMTRLSEWSHTNTWEYSLTAEDITYNKTVKPVKLPASRLGWYGHQQHDYEIV